MGKKDRMEKTKYTTCELACEKDPNMPLPKPQDENLFYSWFKSGIAIKHKDLLTKREAPCYLPPADPLGYSTRVRQGCIYPRRCSSLTSPFFFCSLLRYLTGTDVQKYRPGFFAKTKSC